MYPHGWNGKQFAKMLEWGMTPMQAIQAATVNAADLLGWSDRVGEKPLHISRHLPILRTMSVNLRASVFFFSSFGNPPGSCRRACS